GCSDRKGIGAFRVAGRRRRRIVHWHDSDGDSDRNGVHGHGGRRYVLLCFDGVPRGRFVGIRLGRGLGVIGLCGVVFCLGARGLLGLGVGIGIGLFDGGAVAVGGAFIVVVRWLV